MRRFKRLVSVAVAAVALLAVAFGVPVGATAGVGEVRNETVAFKVLPGADVGAVLRQVARLARTIPPGSLAEVGVFRAEPAQGEASRLVSALAHVPGVAWAEPPQTVRALAAPNDPRFWEQYALVTLQVAKAWETSPGRSDVTVAVVDSGVGPHSDLEGRVLPGRDFITGFASTDTVDRNGHGTAMAGIIAANVNDRRGVAGVAQRVRILPVRVLDAEGMGNDQDAAEGMIWAVDHGADVINVSLGGQWPSEPLKEAVLYARSRGVVVVAAVGNDGAGVPVRYPAALPEVIGVGAVDRVDVHLSSSNAGPEVDLVAPGADILAADIPYHGIAGLDYRVFTGSSFSAAYTAGVAALLLSYDPGLSPDAVQRLLQRSSVDLGPPGRDDEYGAGRVDAVRALALAQGRATLPGDATAPRPAFGLETASGSDVDAPVQLSVQLFADPDRLGVTVRRTLGRPARLASEGQSVLDMPAPSSGLLTAQDPVPPWLSDPGTTVAYYTVFTYDAAGNYSNPVWGFAAAPGSATSGPPPGVSVQFSDVPPSHRFATAIESLAAAGIVSGFPDGSFGPDQRVTRAQFAKMVVLAMGAGPLDSSQGMEATFQDVPVADGYPFVYVEAAAEEGLVRGLGPGSDGGVLFGPQHDVTRLQVAQVVARAGGEKLDMPPAGIVQPYYDVPAYAEPEVMAPWEMGIVHGRGATTFDAWSGATRGQVAEMLYRLRRVLASRP